MPRWSISPVTRPVSPRHHNRQALFQNARGGIDMKIFRPTGIVLVMLSLMYLITYVDRVNVSTASAGFAKDFDLTKTQIGLVFSPFAYPYLLFQIIGGWVSDQFGTRRTLIA